MTAGENGAVDVDKDFCYLISQSLTITTKKTEPIRPAFEETMLIHAIQPPKPCQFPNTMFQLEIKKMKVTNGETQLFFISCLALLGLDI